MNRSVSGIASEPVHDTEPTPRGAFGLLIDPAFGALFWGRMFSIVGVWTHGIVAAVVMFQATGSALMVGLVGVAQFGPQLLLTPVSGRWADTGDPLRQIILGRFLCLAGSGSIAAWLLLRPETSAAVPVLLGTLLVGLGFVCGGPALQSIVPNLIRPGELSTAMALNSIPMTVGRIAGPATGAFLTAQLGPAAAFAVSAGLHLAFAVCLIVAKFPPPPTREDGADSRVWTAVKYVWRDRPLFLALVAVTVVGVASDSSVTLAPSMADHLGGGAGMVGLLSTVFGIGAAVGMALLAGLKGRFAAAHVSAFGLAGLGLGCVVLTAATAPAVGLAGFAVTGLGFGWAMTGLTIVVQERAPEALRGRIMALWLVGFLGSRPIAALLLGGAADLFNVQVAFAVAGAMCIAVVLWCRPSRLDGPLPKGMMPR